MPYNLFNEMKQRIHNIETQIAAENFIQTRPENSWIIRRSTYPGATPLVFSTYLGQVNNVPQYMHMRMTRKTLHAHHRDIAHSIAPSL